MRRRIYKKTHKNHALRKRFRLMETWDVRLAVWVLHRAPECRAARRRTSARIR